MLTDREKGTPAGDFVGFPAEIEHRLFCLNASANDLLKETVSQEPRPKIRKRSKEKPAEEPDWERFGFRGQVAKLLWGRGLWKKAIRFVSCNKCARPGLCSRYPGEHKYFVPNGCEVVFCKECALEVRRELFLSYQAVILAGIMLGVPKGWVLARISFTLRSDGSEITPERVQKANRCVKGVMRKSVGRIRLVPEPRDPPDLSPQPPSSPTKGADAGDENILMIGSTSRSALNVQNPAYGFCSQGVNGVNSDVVMTLTWTRPTTRFDHVAPARPLRAQRPVGRGQQDRCGAVSRARSAHRGHRGGLRDPDPTLRRTQLRQLHQRRQAWAGSRCTSPSRCTTPTRA